MRVLTESYAFTEVSVEFFILAGIHVNQIDLNLQLSPCDFSDSIPFILIPRADQLNFHRLGMITPA